ncbi:HpcH/HpaI aldolase/citrate lyase family protein [candidate division KSB1 bacterium]|nr:HpcH/HpaI aldolase/citrate lyase family protein [candidate division KSB1 bacterium]
MQYTAEAGQKGEDVRSDCRVRVTLRDEGGIELQMVSKVESMYGERNRQLIRDVLAFFRIQHATIDLEDTGALPFVIMARLETAIKRLLPELNQEYLPEMRASCLGKTTRDRFRRSRLYLPGNSPKFMLNSGLHQPDGIILDLEDSVAPSEKDAARILVRNALRQVDFCDAERMARINQLPAGLDDLEIIVPHNVHVVLIPKCENAGQVHLVDQTIKAILSRHQVSDPVYIMPIIESALGAIKAYEIAIASNNVIALTLGLEDYTADIGVQRTQEGKESFWARSQVVNAARAAGIQPIDTVFSDVTDTEGLKASVLEAKALGFEGKGCIHPRQIQPIHKAFAPTSEEIAKAKGIVLAFEAAIQKGLGVIARGSKMIDPPVVKRAQKIVTLAVANRLLHKNWREGGVSDA